MDLKMMLSHKGANYLRDWADAMPVAIQNIIISTEKVVSVYQSVAENVGPHREAFYQMLLTIKKAQEDSVEALSSLPKELKKTADKIDEYCDTSADGTHTPPVKKLTLHR